ncbi:U3 small nucleolar ribonucleoprotein protein IMP4 [Lucilia sericata]|uniref:U3 small nucleolar ribonucleoprotein protein IMP4 n=1 Tax=Lucilia sericata TaxID=13632 RepID=UPI0018A8677C|nr:U3 small nucleolar ribonucleoprotein protein IMP4 [Lucilia sericata]
MLRRQARLRREYLYQKAKENRQNKNKIKKNNLQQSLVQNSYIHGDLQRDAIQIQEKIKYDTIGENLNAFDDEYRYAGCEDPKVMITTSHEPSARLKMFVKELRLVIPNSQRMNRGKYELKQIVHACKANGVTDLIIVHEHRGVPDNLVVCHLPYGPTAFFNISGVVMRHDIPDIGHMSEQNPHLVFHNFKTILGQRVTKILKHIFPVPKEDSKRVISFANHDDFISFRHHTYQSINKELELTEVGPRFQLKLYQIKLGTLDEIHAANTEWVLRPYMNTSMKRRFLSDDDGWVQEDVNRTIIQS